MLPRGINYVVLLSIVEERDLDFAETEEQAMIRDMVRDFAENEIEPIALELDEKENYLIEEEYDNDDVDANIDDQLD